MDELEAVVCVPSLKPLSCRGTKLSSFIDTRYKSVIVFVSFSITIAGWWAWNFFLSCVMPASQSPYAIRDGFTSTFGRDPVWWLTLLIVFVFLATLEFAYKSIKRRFDISRWRIWKRVMKSTDERWSLELWQELEKDPLIRESLRKRANITFEEEVDIRDETGVCG